MIADQQRLWKNLDIKSIKESRTWHTDPDKGDMLQFGYQEKSVQNIFVYRRQECRSQPWGIRIV